MKFSKYGGQKLLPPFNSWWLSVLVRFASIRSGFWVPFGGAKLRGFWFFFFLLGGGCFFFLARVLGQGRGGFCLRLRFVSHDSVGNCATCGSILTLVSVSAVCVCCVCVCCLFVCVWGGRGVGSHPSVWVWVWDLVYLWALIKLPIIRCNKVESFEAFSTFSWPLWKRAPTSLSKETDPPTPRSQQQTPPQFSHFHILSCRNRQHTRNARTDTPR